MITINFHFKNRAKEDLAQLNALLATMQLDSLELEDLSGYLAVTRDRDGKLLNKRYGLDSGALVCELASRGSGHQYRIDTCVADCALDHDAYLEAWRAANPGRAMRCVIITSFPEDNAFIIAHHEKPNAAIADFACESEDAFN